jgi:hypothetical protein
MTSKIPYTHWSYFDDRTAADACAKELDDRFDCLTSVERSYDDTQWLMLAARTVSLDWPGGWHQEIEEVVEHYGGRYDGGESGWLDTTTGQFIVQAEGRTDG